MKLSIAQLKAAVASYVDENKIRYCIFIEVIFFIAYPLFPK